MMPAYKLPKPIECSDIVRLIPEHPMTVIGAQERHIEAVAGLEYAGKGDLTFCSSVGSEGYHRIEDSGAEVVICRPDLPNVDTLSEAKTLLLTEDPVLLFVRCLNRLFPEEFECGIDGTAVIGRHCQIDPSTRIDAYAVIGDSVEIGARTQIEGGVKIFTGVRIGEDVRIWSNSAIGIDGLAYAKNAEGVYERFLHFGSVRIESNVDIGANACVVRGMMQDTLVGQGTKIGNRVNVGHNVQIGRNCFISPGAVLCGSAVVEDECWIGPLASILNHVRVCKGATVGMGAVVTRDVPSGATVVGNPARVLKRASHEK